jgi:peptidyl-prolyl cis-trans isomerase D
MLSSMRSFAKSAWAGLLLALLILALGAGLFYTNPFSGLTGGAFFSAGEYTIGARDVNRALTQYVERARQETGKPMTEREAAQQGVAQQIINDLGQRTMVLAFADRIGVKASASAVTDQIASSPQLKDALGRVDRAALEAFAQQMGLPDVRQLEAVWREDLTLQYVDQAIGAGLTAPAVLIKPLAAYFGEQRTFSFARLGPESVPVPPAPTDAELAAYYEAQKARFEEPERRSFSVVTVSADDFLGKVQLTDAEVRAEYDRRIKDFSEPETRQIAQFSGSTQSSVQAVVDLVKQGAPIADAVARTQGVTLETLTVRPGDIKDENLNEAAFGLPLNEIFGPIPSEGRFYGVQVAGITPGAAQPFEAVSEQVRDAMVRREAERLFEASEETFFDLADSGMPLEEVAAQLGAPMISFAPVDRQGRLASGEPAPALAADTEGLTALFEGEELNRKHVSQLEGARAIMRLDAIVPARTPDLAEIRTDVEALYRAEKRQEAAEKLIADTVAAINSGSEFFAAANDAKLISVRPPQPFMRANPGALDPGVMAAAFDAPAGRTVVARSSQAEPWIVRVETVEPASPELAVQVEAQVSEQIAQSLRVDLNQVFLQDVRETIDLRTNQRTIDDYLKSFEDEPQS